MALEEVVLPVRELHALVKEGKTVRLTAPAAAAIFISGATHAWRRRKLNGRAHWKRADREHCRKQSESQSPALLLSESLFHISPPLGIVDPILAPRESFASRSSPNKMNLEPRRQAVPFFPIQEVLR